ncbi:MAG: hypothetical protein Q4A31_11825 [Corynebacterium sp.]|nr:hypothetical protein [Corynebacterium sp.]MDO4762601.1 hypothetical protein [Corynebacterium sp.]
MPRKFDQDAKDRVIRLVEDRILAEDLPVAGSVSVCGTEAWCVVAYDTSMGAAS